MPLPRAPGGEPGGDAEPSHDRVRWLREVDANTADTVAVVARDGTLLHASASAAAHLGYDVDACIGTPVTSLLHPDDLRRLVRAARRALRRPGSTRRGVGRLRHTDGSWRTHEITLTAPPAAGGAELVVRASDLTAVEQLELKLHRAEALQVVGQTTASLVHDFANLVVLIQCGAAVALHKLPADSEVRADVETIATAGQNAARLAREILDFARGTLPTDGPTRLDEVIGATLPVLVRSLGSVGVRVETALHAPTAAVAIGAAPVQQILINLALNARDAMPEGGVLSIFVDRIQVTPPALPPFPSTLRAGPYLRIEVSDTGVGMDEQTRMRVFEPFFTTKPGGTGLGLPTIRTILSRHGGCVWVESRRGAGSTFTVLLPEHTPIADAHPGAEALRILPLAVESWGVATPSATLSAVAG